MSWLWHCMGVFVEWWVGVLMWGIVALIVAGAWHWIDRAWTYWRKPSGSGF